MGEFFKGWRRKTGVVTLLMSCVFAAGWVRSLRIGDTVQFARHPIGFWVRSFSGNIESRTYSYKFNFYRRWRSLPFDEEIRTRELEELVEEEARTADANSEKIKRRKGAVSANTKHFLPSELRASIPYWSIVIPLTLLSAYLLLIKPRVAKPKADSEN